jgi:3D (Asp-Asp-Asp) domain-containing protein
MEKVQTSEGARIKRRTALSFSLGVVIIVCCFALLLTPFSPLHADIYTAPWNGNFVAYNTGDTVSYQGQIYVCIQSHTSEPNWDPADTAALWQLSSSSSGSTFLGFSRAAVITPTPTPIVSSAYVPPSNPPVVPNIVSNAVQNAPTPTPIPTTAPTNSQSIPVSVTFYTDEGLMADGQETHVGACAVFRNQFPLGTELALYDPSNLSQPVYTCTAEDTGTAICQNDIDVAMPGQVQEALQLGNKQMLAEVVGFDQTVAQEAAANHPASMGCEG